MVAFLYDKTSLHSDLPTYLTNLHVNSNVQEIESDAFDGCYELEEAVLSEGLQVVGRYAFRNCTTLRRVGSSSSSAVMRQLPSTLREIQEEAFRGCESLESIDFPEQQKRVIRLGKRCFCSCSALTTVKIPSSIEVLSSASFAFCTSLRSLDLSRANRLTAIQEMAFSNCHSIREVRFPKSLQKIGPHAFACCYALETVHFESQVSCCFIAYHAFSNCTSLKAIALPQEMKVIEDDTFCGCTSLEAIVIPPTVVRIGTRAFYKCKAMTKVLIPSSVLSVGESSFAFCEKLKSIDFENDSSSQLQRIHENACLRCDSLTHVRTPSGLVDMNKTAFCLCLNLMSLEVPEGMEYSHPSIGNLKLRFRDLPVHKLCFFQSYHHLPESLGELENALKTDPTSMTKKDALGKTPCHILSLSLAPQLALFQAILEKMGGSNAADLLLKTRDNSGSTPMDYLCLNPAAESTAVLQALLFPAFANRIKWLGQGRWKTAMMETIARPVGRDPSSRQRSIQTIKYKLARYERFESLTLLELALWKARMSKDGLDRETCRIQSGADAVLPNVLDFLDMF